MKKAFTLIELLVVIAIIALLLSVVTPSLRKAKEYAKVLICKANNRSLMLGFQSYVQDNDQKGFSLNDLSVTNVMWTEQLSRYLNVDEVRYCPTVAANVEDKKQEFIAGIDNPSKYHGTDAKPWCRQGATAGTYELGSYGFNEWLHSENAYIPESDPKSKNLFNRVTNVQVPGATPVFVSSAKWTGSYPDNNNLVPGQNFDYTGQTWVAGNWDNMMNRFLIDRHKKMSATVSYIDGHVDMVPFSDFWIQSWHRNSKPRYDVRLP